MFNFIKRYRSEEHLRLKKLVDYLCEQQESNFIQLDYDKRFQYENSFPSLSSYLPHRDYTGYALSIGKEKIIFSIQRGRGLYRDGALIASLNSNQELPSVVYPKYLLLRIRLFYKAIKIERYYESLVTNKAMCSIEQIVSDSMLLRAEEIVEDYKSRK